MYQYAESCLFDDKHTKLGLLLYRQDIYDNAAIGLALKRNIQKPQITLFMW
jgi:hypothetical protein